MRPPSQPSASHLSTLPYTSSLVPLDAESKEYYLDYLSLAFTILVTKQVGSPPADPEAPYIFYNL